MKPIHEVIYYGILVLLFFIGFILLSFAFKISGDWDSLRKVVRRCWRLVRK